MSVWEKALINTDRGRVEATMPVIVSASRATDIPAFYPRWFMQRLHRGYLVKNNPFSGKPEVIGLERMRLVVFWTKYPLPIMKYLDELDARGINYYFLYTVNDYPEYELYVPPLARRVEVFRRLSDRLGPQRVIWRYDPLLLSQRIGAQQLLARIDAIARELSGYTRRLIFSFADLSYRKVQNSLRRHKADIYEPDVEEKFLIVRTLKELADSRGMELRSCACREDFSSLGVRPGKCIDDELMVRLFADDAELMRFLGYVPGKNYVSSPRLKDKGQRPACRCIYSKDIGRYNTCPFGCIYCYANVSHQAALENYKRHNYGNESL